MSSIIVNMLSVVMVDIITSCAEIVDKDVASVADTSKWLMLE